MATLSGVGSYANQGECAKREESKLEIGLMNFGEQVNRAAELAERLNRIANRLAGSEPESKPLNNTLAGNVPRPVESHLERMHRLFADNAEILERTARTVVRLEDSAG